MKKILVLAAAVALFAAPALAANIAGTGHDLSNDTLGSTEICVYCHTPHGSNTGVTTAPLWNRTAFDAEAKGWTEYTIGGTYQGGAQNLNSGSMPLCFSCHDGVAAAAEIFNQPYANPVTANLNLSTGNIAGDTAQMSNDHPVGFNYAAAQALDIELYDETVGTVIPRIPLGIVECASCHDVHSNAIPPFLVTTNAGSALCRACHIK